MDREADDTAETSRRPRRGRDPPQFTGLPDRPPRSRKPKKTEVDDSRQDDDRSKATLQESKDEAAVVGTLPLVDQNMMADKTSCSPVEATVPSLEEKEEEEEKHEISKIIEQDDAGDAEKRQKVLRKIGEILMKKIDGSFEDRMEKCAVVAGGFLELIEADFNKKNEVQEDPLHKEILRMFKDLFYFDGTPASGPKDRLGIFVIFRSAWDESYFNHLTRQYFRDEWNEEIPEVAKPKNEFYDMAREKILHKQRESETQVNLPTGQASTADCHQDFLGKSSPETLSTYNQEANKPVRTFCTSSAEEMTTMEEALSNLMETKMQLMESATASPMPSLKNVFTTDERIIRFLLSLAKYNKDIVQALNCPSVDTFEDEGGQGIVQSSELALLEDLFLELIHVKPDAFVDSARCCLSIATDEEVAKAIKNTLMADDAQMHFLKYLRGIGRIEFRWKFTNMCKKLEIPSSSYDHLSDEGRYLVVENEWKQNRFAVEESFLYKSPDPTESKNPPRSSHGLATPGFDSPTFRHRRAGNIQEQKTPRIGNRTQRKTLTSRPTATICTTSLSPTPGPTYTQEDNYYAKSDQKIFDRSEEELRAYFRVLARAGFGQGLHNQIRYIKAGMENGRKDFLKLLDSPPADLVNFDIIPDQSCGTEEGIDWYIEKLVEFLFKFAKFVSGKDFETMIFSAFVMLHVIPNKVGDVHFKNLKLDYNAEDHLKASLKAIEQSSEDTPYKRLFRAAVIECLINSRDAGFDVDTWARMITKCWPSQQQGSSHTKNQPQEEKARETKLRILQGKANMQLIKSLPLKKRVVLDDLNEVDPRTISPTTALDDLANFREFTATGIIHHSDKFYQWAKASDRKRRKGASPQKHEVAISIALSSYNSKAEICPHQAGKAVSLDDIDVLDVLGKGAFGVVILVRLKKNPRLLFAMKVEMFDEESFYNYHCRSLLANSKVNHPNILPTLGYLSLDLTEDAMTVLKKDHVAIATIFPLGCATLEERMKEANALVASKYWSEEDYLCWVGKVLLGLLKGCVAMHDKDVIHRDLKPENVLFCEIKFSPEITEDVSALDGTAHFAPKADVDNVALSSDKKEVIRIADHGLARESAIDGDERQVTRKAGTPLYISPEIERGLKAGTRSDVYSVGVIVYELVKGKVPAAVAGQESISNEGMTDHSSFSDFPAGMALLSLMSKEKMRAGYGISNLGKLKEAIQKRPTSKDCLKEVQDAFAHLFFEELATLP